VDLPLHTHILYIYLEERAVLLSSTFHGMLITRMYFSLYFLPMETFYGDYWNLPLTLSQVVKRCGLGWGLVFGLSFDQSNR
jgi:hypothetical protein